MMQCTAEQIQAKRAEALRKLAAKKVANQNASPKTNGYQSSFFKMKEDSSVKQHQSSPKAKSNYFKMRDNSVQQSMKQNHYKPYEKQAIGVQKPLQFYGVKNEVTTAKLALVSSNRFAVTFSGFNQAAIDVMKTLPTRFYDPQSRVWNFNITDYESLQRKLAPLKPAIVVDKLPTYVLKVCWQKGDNNIYDLNCIDNELLTALMPFQEEGVCFGISKNGRCMIADDMGLGKTFQALGIACYYKPDWPLLIVTTASMRNVWEETIHKYLTSVPVMSVQYMTSGKDFIDRALILIVSHDLLTRCTDKLLQRNFGVIIIDESHVLKNFRAKCTKAAIDVCKKAKRVILLSGTPALSRPSELFSQLSLIDGKFFGTFYEFSSRYCDGKQTSFGWDASGQSNLQELEIILAKKFMIRRTKEEVLKSLPNKTQEVVTLDVQLSQFSQEDQDCLMSLAAKYANVKKDKHAALLTFFAETAKIKVPSVCSYIMQVLETDKKFLVFAHHQVMLNAIEKVLVKKNKKFIRIDGNTTCDQRKYYVDKFQLDDSFTCAVLSITAANAGITLTAAQLVLFAELHWNPSILSQAESRAHRIGQEGHVTIQYLLAPGTSDDSIWPLLQNKQKTLKEIGLMSESYKDVNVTNQKKPASDGQIPTNLNSSLTRSNTLDISSYFKTPEKKTPNTDCDDDLLDEDIDIFMNFQTQRDLPNSIRSETPKNDANRTLEEHMLDDDLDDLFNGIDF